MQIIEFLFWLSFAFIFYNYLGYALVIWVLIRIKKIFKMEAGEPDAFPLPAITLIVPAYNEEEFIEMKIINSLELDYPAEKLKFIFITDGSDDRTPAIVKRYPQITLLHIPERSGKTAALNRAMAMVATPIVVFCDANTLLNPEAIKKIVKHYSAPKVGGVAGEKKVISDPVSKVNGVGEGLYWKYESWLKTLDAELYSVVGAAGELFSIRSELWEPVEEEVILDDFVISLRINLKGYRIAYEPGAYAMESPSASIKEEQKRKIRISAGAFQAMGILKDLFNVFRHPVLCFQFLSHRFLRWTITPVSLVVLLLTGLWLSMTDEGFFYKIASSCQLVFYGFSLLGYYYADKQIRLKVLHISYYFFFMNFSVFQGFLRFLRGRQSAVWEKSRREQPQLTR